jgi:hypothetical protein
LHRRLIVLFVGEGIIGAAGIEHDAEGFEPAALLGNGDFQRRETDGVDIRHNLDLGLMPFEARYEVVRAGAEADQKNDDNDTDAGHESPSGSAEFESAHVLIIKKNDCKWFCNSG